MKSKSAPKVVDSHITALSEKVAEWRQRRTHLRAPMPEELWDEVAALTDHFSPSDLGRILNLPTKKILSRMRKSSGGSAAPKVVRLAPLVFQGPSQASE